MIVKPKIRGFICTTAHPIGCEHQVQEQVNYVEKQPHIEGPKKVLVIGASTGYGLASRIVATFGAGADTLGVSFEKPASDNRTGTAGWYNTAAFEKLAREKGVYADSLFGDAFSDEVKTQTIERIQQDFGKVDLVIYSLASPRRTHPKTGETYSSVLKPLHAPYTNKTINVQSGAVSDITIEPATKEEVSHTVTVMGGEDWEMWISALEEAGVLSDQFTTVAYSYIGPELTYAIYRDGTIGQAKAHLEATALKLNSRLKEKGGRAFVSVNKALVTQSSSAIPVVPLYISLLFKIMKEKQTHEGCIEQMYRLFQDRLYGRTDTPLDDQGRIRLDELEMQEDVQTLVSKLWAEVNSENVSQISDLEGYRSDFLKLFGFGIDEIDYEKDVEV